MDIIYLHYLSDYPMYTISLITFAGQHGIGSMGFKQTYEFLLIY